jgi:D-alanine-D-alanine ligase
MNKKAIILYNQVLNRNPDEMDVIHQKDLVKKACKNLKWDVVCIAVGDDLMKALLKVKKAKPDLVFNLVEALWGKGELIYFVPAILNSFKIPYTGVPLDALFVTTNKVLAKKIMRSYDLPTADFFSVNELDMLNNSKTYIAKPIWEEASVGISEDFIFKPSEKHKIKKIRQLSASHYFIEEYIDGREFNVSLLSGKNGLEVLPPAEIVFSEYFKDKYKIVGYKAKWDKNSEEYKHSKRVFGGLEENRKLEKELMKVLLKLWKVFNLRGYARVDFRVDGANKIYVLEINGNPCIAPDSGFVAANSYAGYTVEMMIGRILKDLN